MYNQNDPVTEEELVLRRIPNLSNFIDFNLAIPISRCAFQPSKNDIDGLSVFRELFITASELAASGQNPAGYYVARIKVVDVNILNLSVIPDPQEDQPLGHALIPELNTNFNKKNKRRAKEIQHYLSQIASLDIAYSPEDKK